MSRRRVKCLSFCVWITCLLVSSVSIYTTRRDIIYDPDLCRCLYDRGATSYVRIALIFVFSVVPLAAILALNVSTGLIAVAHSQTRGERSLKAPLTVFCVSAVLLLTVGPFAAYCLMTAVESDHSHWSQLKILSGYIYYINVFSNPIIYTMTNSRFFNFVKFKLCPCVAEGDINERIASRLTLGRKNSSFYLKSRNFSVSYKASTNGNTG
jgi:hypothetical protein